MIRNILTLGLWTLVSRGAGLARDLMMANYLGAGAVAVAFNVAFSLPNMVRRFFAEGAFNQAFVPIYAKKLQAGEDAESFAQAGAGWVHPQASLEPKAFAQFLTSLRSQQGQLQQAAAAALGHGKPDAAQRLADLAVKLAGK